MLNSKDGHEEKWKLYHNIAQKEPNKNFGTLDHALFNLGHIQNPTLLSMEHKCT